MSTFLLKNVVLSYPYLANANPKQVSNEGKPLYTACLLIDKDDKKYPNQLQELNLAIRTEAQKAMQNIWQNVAPKNYSPLKDGDGVKENGNHYGAECKERFLLNVKSTRKPHLVDEFKKPVKDEVEKFYPGCRIHAEINLFAYNMNGKKGITARIVNVMFAGHDKRLGGDKTPEEAFADIPTATEPLENTLDFGLSEDLPWI